MQKERKMLKTLKELYRGNLVPCEQGGSNSQHIKDLLQLIQNNRDKLCQNLTEEQKAILEKYDSHIADMNELLCEDSFASGYCLGTRMTVAALSDD